MTYIRIDTKTKQAKKFVELIETMPFAEILVEPNSTTRAAIDNATKGKTRKHKNAGELITFLNK
jgi:antitoxin component of RelBE/YafQ-DinJ toxin-antitoxin module